jgi:hypothetical protein
MTMVYGTYDMLGSTIADNFVKTHEKEITFLHNLYKYNICFLEVRVLPSKLAKSACAYTSHIFQNFFILK